MTDNDIPMPEVGDLLHSTFYEQTYEVVALSSDKTGVHVKRFTPGGRLADDFWLWGVHELIRDNRWKIVPDLGVEIDVEPEDVLVRAERRAPRNVEVMYEDPDRELISAMRDELIELRDQLKKLHSLCDEVGIMHDAGVLVRHWRGTERLDSYLRGQTDTVNGLKEIGRLLYGVE